MDSTAGTQARLGALPGGHCVTKALVSAEEAVFGYRQSFGEYRKKCFGLPNREVRVGDEWLAPFLEFKKSLSAHRILDSLRQHESNAKQVKTDIRCEVVAAT